MKIYLGSASPRRHMLVKELGIQAEIILKDIEEVYPDSLSAEQVAPYLSELKAKAIYADVPRNSVLITADTVVILDQMILGKPQSSEEAFSMLSSLSDKTHSVITGVTIASINGFNTFSSRTEVEFHELSRKEIEIYINEYQPFDKAGSYGIQEWMGYVGIKSIKGSFYNVMGLPTDLLYKELRKMDVIKQSQKST